MRSAGPFPSALTGAHTAWRHWSKEPSKNIDRDQFETTRDKEAMNRNPDAMHMNDDDTCSDSSSESEEAEDELPELIPRVNNDAADKEDELTELVPRNTHKTQKHQQRKKGTVEDDEGPWGLPMVLASKPDLAHVHWSEFIVWLCVSYRTLNTVT
jgi:hypothetical protein